MLRDCVLIINCSSLWRAIQTWFIDFNDRNSLSTRLNVVLIITPLVGLYLSNSLRKYSQENEMKKDPSMEFYLNLVHQYPSRLSLFTRFNSLEFFHQYISNQLSSSVFKRILKKSMVICILIKIYSMG